MRHDCIVAKFKVGDRVHFPYGRKIGTITHVEAQVIDHQDGHCKVFIQFLYRITSYECGENQVKKVRPSFRKPPYKPSYAL
jgi:hypothetical protein